MLNPPPPPPKKKKKFSFDLRLSWTPPTSTGTRIRSCEEIDQSKLFTLIMTTTVAKIGFSLWLLHTSLTVINPVSRSVVLWFSLHSFFCSLWHVWFLSISHISVGLLEAFPNIDDFSRDPSSACALSSTTPRLQHTPQCAIRGSCQSHSLSFKKVEEKEKKKEKKKRGTRDLCKVLHNAMANKVVFSC